MANSNAWAKKAIKQLRIDFGAKCEFCGLHISRTKINLEFAHIHGKPTKLSGHNSRGSKERICDIRQNRESYRLLCDKCHSDYDNNSRAYIALENLFSK